MIFLTGSRNRHPATDSLLGDPVRARPDELRCWYDLHPFREPGTRSLERAFSSLTAGRRLQSGACQATNFLLAVLKACKRPAHERSPLRHRVPTTLNAAPVGFVFAEVSGNQNGHRIFLRFRRRSRCKLRWGNATGRLEDIRLSGADPSSGPHRAPQDSRKRVDL
jgi:hypothetical protein